MSIYSVGTKVCAVWKDGTPHVAEVIQRRLRNDAGEIVVDYKAQERDDNPAHWEYYLHYVDYDRRLDEWCSSARVLGPHEADEPEAVTTRHGRFKRSRVPGGGAVAIMDPTVAALEREHEEITKVKNIGTVVLGKWAMDAWYFSPYPEEYWGSYLFICEYSLKYMKKPSTLARHRAHCTLRHPPGNEIYRHGALSVWEVDGAAQKIYCQNLCLLAKLFLDHKTLYYDVEPFWFYVLTECDDSGAHIVGYFSKEKASAEGYNLACILTLPPYQRRGYGKFLISFSYELSKLEGKPGSPEKPLSDLGKLSYRSFWTYVILSELRAAPEPLSIRELAAKTSFTIADIVATLQALGMIRYWRGAYAISVSQEQLDKYLSTSHASQHFAVPEAIRWKPPPAPPKAALRRKKSTSSTQ